MSVKTYRLLRYLEHYVYVQLEGRKEELSIPFTGGTKVPKRILGSYTTADQDIQKALEKHKKYDIDFTCVSGKTIKAGSPTKELTPGEPVEVTNFSQAKKYLVDNHDVSPGDIPNKEALEKKAEELGVQFSYKAKEE
jgi:hypothetical protein